jgi:hypothetical protein
MSILSRLLGRARSASTAAYAPPPVDTLVQDPRLSATRLGGIPNVTPWSAVRLMGIFQAFATNPTHVGMTEARLARQCLSQFWLVAPVDQLEVLYRSSIGECYRLLLAGRLAQEPLLPEEQVWKDSLAQRLITSFERPETTNVLLAAMPYFAPGKMRVADPLSQVPGWLQEDYARLYEPQLLQQVWRPAGLLGPAGQAAGRSYGQAPSLGMNALVGSQPSVAPLSPQQQGGAAGSQAAPAFPQLAQERGNDALARVQAEEFQSRMNGLINLHVIDPADAEVAEQLAGLRRLLGQIWLDAPQQQMEELYRSSFGELYRNLLASGFSRRPISDQDRQVRQQLARFVADMSKPRAINALMAALPFYPPGKIAFGGGEQHMPVWLVREINNIYGQKSGETPPAL